MSTRSNQDMVETPLTPRERRRVARRNDILRVAWELAARDGITAISLRELADRVDLRQPSLYGYFASKADLYDTMFAEGFQELVDERERLVLDQEPIVALQQGCRHFIEFCVANPVRYQLLFQHSIPGFSPSAASMEISGQALAYLERWLGAAGITETAGLDLLRAMLLGLAGEQIANEPGGQRWIRFTDDLVDVIVETLRRHRDPSTGSKPTRKEAPRG